MLGTVGVETEQPNSAVRKRVRVRLAKNAKRVTVFLLNNGCLNFIEENDEVLVVRFHRKGNAISDMSGICF